jgi:hypothetical protein
MHARRFACMLLGMWLAGSAVMTWIASDSVNAAPRILANHSPDFAIRLKSMGREDARMLLAYPVRQQVSWWLAEFGTLEIAAGALLFLFLLLGTREGKITLGISLVPLAVAIFKRAFLIPQLLGLGGLTDFVPANMALAERGQLDAARMGLLIVEGLELVTGTILAAILIGRQHGRSGLTLEEVDAINKADDRHVNR